MEWSAAYNGRNYAWIWWEGTAITMSIEEAWNIRETMIKPGFPILWLSRNLEHMLLRALQ